MCHNSHHPFLHAARWLTSVACQSVACECQVYPVNCLQVAHNLEELQGVDLDNHNELASISLVILVDKHPFSLLQHINKFPWSTEQFNVQDHEGLLRCTVSTTEGYVQALQLQ